MYALQNANHCMRIITYNYKWPGFKNSPLYDMFVKIPQLINVPTVVWSSLHEKNKTDTRSLRQWKHVLQLCKDINSFSFQIFCYVYRWIGSSIWTYYYLISNAVIVWKFNKFVQLCWNKQKSGRYSDLQNDDKFIETIVH